MRWRHRSSPLRSREAVLFDARSEPGAAARLLEYDTRLPCRGTGVTTERHKRHPAPVQRSDGLHSDEA